MRLKSSVLKSFDALFATTDIYWLLNWCNFSPVCATLHDCRESKEEIVVESVDNQRSLVLALAGLSVGLTVSLVWIVSARCLARKGANVESAPVPGTRVAARYLDDDVDHERILIWLVSPLHWFAVSLDDDERSSVRDGPNVVDCPVRYEREAGEPMLYRFRERLPRLMTECRERAEWEPYYTGTEAPTAAYVGGLHLPVRMAEDGCITVPFEKTFPSCGEDSDKRVKKRHGV